MARKSKKKAAKPQKITLEAGMPGGDPLRFQVAAIIKRPKHVKLTKELLAEMVRRKAAGSAGLWDGTKVVGATEGPDPSGIKLKITSWRNPKRKGEAKNRANRSHGTQAERWGSLRRAIEKARIVFR